MEGDTCVRCLVKAGSRNIAAVIADVGANDTFMGLCGRIAQGKLRLGEYIARHEVCASRQLLVLALL